MSTRSKLTIYKPIGADDCQLCHPIHSEDFERINLEINGSPRSREWLPVPMKIIHEDQGRQLSSSDAPWLGSHALVFKRKASDALASLLQACGELLPLVCAEVSVQIYNPRVLDVLDVEVSSVLRFSSGRIMSVQRYVFRPSLIEAVDIFKIPDLRVSPTFVSHRFVDHWKRSGLKGLDFERVWTQ